MRHIHWFRLIQDDGWTNQGGLLSRKRIYKCRFCTTHRLNISGTFKE